MVNSVGDLSKILSGLWARKMQDTTYNQQIYAVKSSTGAVTLQQIQNIMNIYLKWKSMKLLAT
jgi:hypothetical protein